MVFVGFVAVVGWLRNGAAGWRCRCCGVLAGWCAAGLVFVGCFTASADSGVDVYGKLFERLDRYGIVSEGYSEWNFPIMSGNGEMGGLMDPLGRGVANIELTGLYLNEVGRVIGPGLMVRPVGFAGLRPVVYRQVYDLRSGVLTTDVGYVNGGYRSTVFFSHDDRRLLVVMMENLGDGPMVCNVSTGRLGMDLVGFSDCSVLFGLGVGSFSDLSYRLVSSVGFERSNFPNVGFLPWLRDVCVSVPAGGRLVVVAVVEAGRCDGDGVVDGSVGVCDVATDFEVLLGRSAAAWEREWRSMGFVVLPDGEHARVYYRSLHWLQCAAGYGGWLPGECQGGVFSSFTAEDYGLQVNQNLGNVTPWQGLPFTYGGAGWATLAYSFLGDSARAGNMLRLFYRPESLRDNVRGMFPVGRHEFVYGGRGRGEWVYLKDSVGDAFAFGHENLFDMRNHGVGLYDKQVHVQGFGPSLFVHFNGLYGLMGDTVYSVLRGCAEFWRGILWYDAVNGVYTLPPLLSVTEDLFEAGLLDGLLAARWTLERAAGMAEGLGVDSVLRGVWRDVARGIGFGVRDGVYCEFAGDDGSRDGAGYMGIRGYVYLGFPTVGLGGCLSADVVGRSLDRCWERNLRGRGMITFVANWFALADLYGGRGEEAFEKWSYCLSQVEGVTSSMCEQEGRLFYFLGGYASFVMVPTAMVLQSDVDGIRVFPAVPGVFGDIEFYNLPAWGGVRVSGVMRDGVVEGVWYGWR
jgi:hypothetical protein